MKKRFFYPVKEPYQATKDDDFHVFVDYQAKQVYIFDQEEVQLQADDKAKHNKKARTQQNE